MRVALTGGATGIGAAVASRFKQSGHEVIAFDISRPEANIDHWIETDLSDPDSISAAIKLAEGPFDALINNAGIPPRDGLEESILKVNFIGLRLFLDGMLDKLQPGASIVSTASRAGAMWHENLNEVKALIALNPTELPAFIADRKIDPVRAYNLSKEAVIVLTMSLTESLLARNFRINSVSPAAVSTDILQDFATAFGDKVAKNIARVGRAGEAAEIAEVIFFLATSNSRWINGQDLVIDGGMSAINGSDIMNLNNGT